MNNKKFILNADDFGLSKEINRAIVDAYNEGILKSASLCANGDAFDSAINEIIPECPDLCIGVHLNIIESKSLKSFTELPMLTNIEGYFNKSFIKLLSLSNNTLFLKQVELEFRAQIEKILEYTKVTHIDSHVHVHSIPNIFKITCKLAKEYNIPYIRTQFEQPYITPDITKHLNLKYPINLIKIILLNFFSIQNKKMVKKLNLRTNDYLIGVGYTSMMDASTVEHGLNALKNNENIIVEALIHPFCSTCKTSAEYDLTKNQDLKYKISKLGFEITNYQSL